MSALARLATRVADTVARITGDETTFWLYFHGPTVKLADHHLVGAVAVLFDGAAIDRADMPFGSWRFDSCKRADVCRDRIHALYASAGVACPMLIVRTE